MRRTQTNALRSENPLPKVVEGIKFSDGAAITATSMQNAA